ncbi:intraflagellar transport protein 74 [Paragonimus westermani]|uniref:Intraflagellar transport protein 74 n=1 Tax=Paragonimus westermani TaxID=34504 RepID=A0A5J4NWM2_9TREM|nr:intraflagellar transport protein 74 [Paragonimus westermani]
MSAVRPGTASRLKTAQNSLGNNLAGTATRLTTGMRPGTRGGLGVGATLNTSVRVEDRPITQQGLSGLKTAVKGSRRQIEDKPYFLGLLRGKINELNTEIGKINKQTMEAEEDNASFLQYEQMAEKLAMEIKELQGELGDYNTLVDKATLGDDMTNVEMDWEELRASNERAEKSLESLFEERQKKETTLKSLEQELKQEQQMSETLVQEMPDEQRRNYLRLRDLNSHLLVQLSDSQTELEQLVTRRKELEEDLSTSQVKQEAMRLYAQLHEAEARLEQLIAEDASREDPQQERERLLQQVREDNQEIASMERQSREIQEKVSHREEELRALEQELDDNRSERSQKYRELKKREQQIDEFLKTFDEVKEDINRLAVFDYRCLRQLAHIKWTDRMSNVAVRRRVFRNARNARSIGQLITLHSLRWLSHVLRMPAERLPYRELYNETTNSWVKPRGGQATTWSRNMKTLTAPLSKALELSSIAELETNIVELLETTSRNLTNACQTSPAAASLRVTGDDPQGEDSINAMNQLRDQLNFKTTEVSKSEETVIALSKERARLSQDLIKVDQLESKVTQEIESLRKRIAKMEDEIELFSDLDKVKEDAKFKRETLSHEKERLENHRESLHRLNQGLAKEYANMQTNLTNQETNMQLTNLERRWAQHEQINHSLMESIANKRVETDHTGLAAKAMGLVREYNEMLKASLASKPVA